MYEVTTLPYHGLFGAVVPSVLILLSREATSKDIKVCFRSSIGYAMYEQYSGVAKRIAKEQVVRKAS
jgi:hypothetical protein